MSEDEGGGAGGGVMLFLRGATLVMTSLCVSGYERRRRRETD